ncbi:MAG: rhomboid family intramembrane serine protease [Defluviitaleaceae bacterium]|nr:rhomboid family intramembrane serine protease [Defluviitaleaceae bacterium]
MRLKYNSPIILTYSLICIIVLGLGWLTDGASTSRFFVLFFTSFNDPLLYLRIFTHIFGHADWAHFVGNMTMLLLVGPLVEEKYGRNSLVRMILLTTFVGAIVHLLTSNAGALGASGIIFMLVLLASFSNSEKGDLPLTFVLVSIFFLGREVFNAFTIDDNVSRIGHIVGGTLGALLGFLHLSRR